MSRKTFLVPVLDDEDASVPSTSFSKFRKTEVCSEMPGSNFEDCKQTTAASTKLIQAGKIPADSVSASGRTVVVSGRQKGNPLLKFLRNVPWEWGDIVADYQIGPSCCVLFLSVKYHKLHPEYIHTRLKRVGKSFASQLLLVLVDIAEADAALRELNIMSVLSTCWTLLLCWSPEECAEYIEALKIYQNKPPTEFLAGGMDKKRDMDDKSILADLLTTIRGVTKADVDSLIEAFGCLASMADATVDQLALCRGIGALKAQRIFDAFEQPFTKSTISKPQQDSQNSELLDQIFIEEDEVEPEDFS